MECKMTENVRRIKKLAKRLLISFFKRFPLYWAGCIYYFFITRNENKKVKLNLIENIIIVSHPDDEMIFFHTYLKNNANSLVICITNGGNVKRKREFYDSLKYYKATGIMFNFVDNTTFKWNEERLTLKVKGITSKCCHCRVVLTHNNEGEYGHFQHIQTNKIVLKIINDLKIENDISIFAPKTNKSLFNGKFKVLEKELKTKEDLFFRIYKSQAKGILNKEEKYYNYIVYESLEKIN
jgi:LmbE family N-acetylglucosaminyl deacetylase